MIKRLTKFVEDARELEWDDFYKKYDHFVLVIVPTSGSALEKSSTSRHASLSKAESRPPVDSRYRVGILQKRLGNPLNAFISVGRATTNDIVISDIEVSKVHAFFERNESGHWTIRDNRSTNGTYVNGERIDQDERTLIKSSDAIKIGPGVSTVFFDPGDFYQFLKSPEVADSF